MSRYEHPKPDGRTKLRIEPIRVNHAHAIMTEDFDEETSTGIVVARTSDNVDVGWAKLLAAAPELLDVCNEMEHLLREYRGDVQNHILSDTSDRFGGKLRIALQDQAAAASSVCKAARAAARLVADIGGVA